MSQPLIMDIHLDLAMNATVYNRDLRWSHERIRRWELLQTDKPGRGHHVVCFPEMRRARIGLCVATQNGRYSPYFHKLPGWNSPEQAWAHTQAELAWYREMERVGQMTPIRNLDELNQHVEAWTTSDPPDSELNPDFNEHQNEPRLPIGYVRSLEGADSIVTLAHLEKSHEDGLRALGLSHYGPGVYAHGTDDEGPLPERGKELLKKMEELEIILDLTHLCDESFWDSLDNFSGPVWASHQNCRALSPWNRQFSDEMIKAVIARGGVMGMAFDAIMMIPGWDYKKTRAADVGLKIERTCDHIDHICQIAGNANHVGIGTDLDGGYGTEQTPMDLDSIADLQTIPGLLRKRGYSEEDINKVMAFNVIDFLRRAWGE